MQNRNTAATYLSPGSLRMYLTGLYQNVWFIKPQGHTVLACVPAMYVMKLYRARGPPVT